MKCEICGLEIPYDDEECPFCSEGDGDLFLKEQLDSSELRAGTFRVPGQDKPEAESNEGKLLGKLKKSRKQGGADKQPPGSAWK